MGGGRRRSPAAASAAEERGAGEVRHLPLVDADDACAARPAGGGGAPARRQTKRSTSSSLVGPRPCVAGVVAPWLPPLMAHTDPTISTTGERGAQTTTTTLSRFTALVVWGEGGLEEGNDEARRLAGHHHNSSTRAFMSSTMLESQEGRVHRYCNKVYQSVNRAARSSLVVFSSEYEANKKVRSRHFPPRRRVRGFTLPFCSFVARPRHHATFWKTAFLVRFFSLSSSLSSSLCAR